MRQIGTVLLALALQAVMAIPAVADITRGCKARWEVQYGGGARAFGEFESRGRCRSRAYANDCRRAARGYAQECFRGAWNERWNEDVRAGRRKPAGCIGRSNFGVRYYNVTDIKRELERNGCAMLVNRPFTIKLVGRTWGDDRCGGEVVLSTTYGITDEICGKY